MRQGVSGQLLVVDDEVSMCELLADGLGARGYGVRWFTSSVPALAALDDEDFDAVLTDLNLSEGESGLEVCRRIVERRPDLPVVVETAFGSFDAAVAAIRA